MSLAVHLGGGELAHLSAYANKGPILSIFDCNGVDLTITQVNRDKVQPEDVRAARRVLAVVIEYVAECQRLCPESSDDNETVAIASADSEKVA